MVLIMFSFFACFVRMRTRIMRQPVANERAFGSHSAVVIVVITIAKRP